MTEEQRREARWEEERRWNEFMEQKPDNDVDNQLELRHVAAITLIAFAICFMVGWVAFL